MTMPEIDIQQGDDGVEVVQGLPSSHEGEIDSNEEERSLEPQAEEDARNSGGMRNRKIKSSRPEEEVRPGPSELGNGKRDGKEKSSRSGRELDGGVTPDLPPINFIKVFVYGFGEMLAAVSLCSCIHGVLAVLLFLCSRVNIDIVQPWNTLWGVLSCFTAVFGRFWFGFGMDLDRRTSLLYEKVNNYSLLIVLFSILHPNPTLFTYNLEWLGTTYYWHFHVLSFFGYFVGWTVFLRGVESWILELEKHSEDPCLRTAVSGGEDLDTTTLRANYPQDDSMKDQRKKRPSRTVVFGLLILILVTTFEQALGYSIVNVFFRCWVFWGWLLVAKGDFSMADLREMMRYFSPSTYFSH